MAYVVCLIPIVSILLSICILGLHFYLLKVHQNSKPLQASNHSMGYGRCSHASHSLQVVLLPQWNESDVSCALSCLRLLRIKPLLFAQGYHACPWLYRLLYHHFRSVCTSIEGLFTLIPTIHYFLACLMMDIVKNTGVNIIITVTM